MEAMNTFPELLEKLREAKKISKKDLAIRARLTPGYISHLTRGERKAPSEEAVAALADALNLDVEMRQQFFEVAGYPVQSPPSDRLSSPKVKEVWSTEANPVNVDWGEAPNVKTFYGRNEEQVKLESWVIDDHCQMIVILGIGGVGKTTLAAKLTEQIQEEFQYIFWRSLQHAPPVEDILKECIQFLSEQQRDPPTNVNDLIQMLMALLRKKRCLIVLDNLETVLQESQRVGNYREGYESYGRLLQLLGEARHDSCLLLTSREKPKEATLLESTTGPVRSLRLSGVGKREAREILRDKGVHGSDEACDTLFHLYSGNPLALKLVADLINEVFSGDIDAFLKAEEFVFGDIQDLLSEQFRRLSELEQEIVYWLAIEREAASLEELQKDLAHPVDEGELFDAIKSLLQRSLIETEGTARFTLQPVIMEYMTEELVKQTYTELQTEEFIRFKNHSLTIGEAKRYVRNRQTQLILDPLARQLLDFYGKTGSEAKLKKVLIKLQASQPQQSGYAGGNILKLLLHLHLDLRGYDFSSLNIRQVDLQNISLPNVNFADADLSQSIFTDTFGSIFSVALSQDGNFLAVGTSNSQVRLWDAHSGTPLRICRGHADWVRSVAFSPNGKLIASASEDKTIRLWEVQSGECLNVLEGHTNRVCTIAFSPDSNTLVSGSEDQTVRLWDVSSGTLIQVLQGHTDWVNSVAFSPDGSIIASGCGDQTVRLWDVSNGKCLLVLQGHNDKISAIAFGPDGKLIASGSKDQTIRLWEVHTGRCLHMLQGHDGWIKSVAISPDGDLIISGSNDQTIRLWDMRTGQCKHVLQGHNKQVRSVVFSPDGNMVISGSDDQTVRFWEVKSGQRTRVLRGYTNWIYSVAFSPDNQTVASGGDDQVIRLWDTTSGRWKKDLQAKSRVRAIAFSPSGSILASGNEDQIIRIWNVESGECIQTLSGHTDWIKAVAFSPSGNLIASGSDDQTARIWNVTGGECVQILSGHTDWIYSVAFSPDGNTVASGSGDETVRLWEVNSGCCQQILRGHAGRVSCVTFSPDGNFIASGGGDETIRLWDVKSGNCIKILRGHNKWIWSVTFSPDGRTLASGSDDLMVRLWDVSSGQNIKKLEGHSSWIYSVAYNLAGTIIASGSDDGTTRLWSAATGECLHILRGERPYEGMNITNTRGLTITQEEALKGLGAIDNWQEIT